MLKLGTLIFTATTTIFSVITILPVHLTGRNHHHFVRDFFNVRTFVMYHFCWCNIFFLFYFVLQSSFPLWIRISFWSLHSIQAFNGVKDVWPQLHDQVWKANTVLCLIAKSEILQKQPSVTMERNHLCT